MCVHAAPALECTIRVVSSWRLSKSIGYSLVHKFYLYHGISLTDLEKPYIENKMVAYSNSERVQPELFGINSMGNTFEIT